MFKSLVKLFEAAAENVEFLLMSVAIVAVILFAAHAAEVIIAKKNGYNMKSEKSKTLRMTIIAVFSAAAAVLMLFEIPLWFLPGFYKIDLSELPVMIGAFSLGPAAGVMIEFIKVLLNLLINGTSTAFVGEFANFLIGCSFVVPASIIYFAKKTKKNAIIGLITGSVCTALIGCVLNAFVLLPAYAEAFHAPIEAFIAQGTDKNALISNMFTFCVFAVTPFNLIKCIAVSVITLLVYKHISRLLKQDYYETVPAAAKAK